MKFRSVDILLLFALVAGASFFATHWVEVTGDAKVAWKGAGVALLSLWAFARGRPWIGLVLAFGALGDVLLEAAGLITGAVAFLLGHVIATGFYWRTRRAPFYVPMGIAVAVVLASYATSGGDAGVAFYGLGLGAMAGTALTSGFSPRTVGLGAVLFVVSDLLIFSSLGIAPHSPIPPLLIWPTYFAGQALIAWGVVGSQGRENIHHRI